jgi:hypothetical protein
VAPPFWGFWGLGRSHAGRAFTRGLKHLRDRAGVVPHAEAAGIPNAQGASDLRKNVAIALISPSDNYVGRRSGLSAHLRAVGAPIISVDTKLDARFHLARRAAQAKFRNPFDRRHSLDLPQGSPDRACGAQWNSEGGSMLCDAFAGLTLLEQTGNTDYARCIRTVQAS